MLEDNERLEFLGDAVIDFVVAGFLYHRFPEMDEGELTALRAALVRAETLAGFARQIDLGQHLRLGLGEEDNGGRERVPLLCATFEAVAGAIYLDRGLDEARRFIEPLVRPALEAIRAGDLHKDAKSEFQVWAQARLDVYKRQGIDRLKEIVPVWKKEIGSDRSVWVEGHYRPTTDDNL